MLDQNGQALCLDQTVLQREIERIRPRRALQILILFFGRDVILQGQIDGRQIQRDLAGRFDADRKEEIPVMEFFIKLINDRRCISAVDRDRFVAFKMDIAAASGHVQHACKICAEGIGAGFFAVDIPRLDDRTAGTALHRPDALRRRRCLIQRQSRGQIQRQSAVR